MTDTLSEHIDAVRAGDNPQACFEIFIEILPAYGFTQALFGHVINPLMYGPAATKAVLTNWNPKWLQIWIENNYLFHDPIALHVLRTTETFSWDEAFSRAGRTGRKILTAARNYDLVFGIAVPVIRDRGPRGIISLSSAQPPDTPADWADITQLARATFYRIDEVRDVQPFDDSPSFTDREIQVLYLMAAGKTNWEAGIMLQISEHSVRDYTQSISKKLGTTNRAHSVARAIQLGVIIA